MKFTEQDLDSLVRAIKAFKAGIIDKKLDEHIDACVDQLKTSVAARKPWWKFW
jgi:hypothetical protein